jgi:hypothetical protein
MYEAVLWAASIAGKAHVTIATVLGKCVLLVTPELPLSVGSHKIAERALPNVAEFEVGFNKMIARIKIPIVLQSNRIATSGSKHTDTIHTDVRPQRRVEHLDVHGSDIMPHPLVEYFRKKLAELIRANRALRDLVSALDV